MDVIGQSSDATSDIVFAVAISAGGVAVITLVGLYIKYRMSKRNGQSSGGKTPPNDPDPPIA